MQPTGPEKIDVVVLGAGVVGLSTARQLGSRGIRAVVIDMAAPGGQGSRAAAGVAIPSVRLLDDPEMLAFTQAGADLLEKELASLPDPGTLRRGSGIVRMVPDERTRADLEQRAARSPQWLGTWAPRDELVSLEPALAGTPLLGGFLSDAGFMVDTEAYLGQLVHELVRSGIPVRLSERVLQVSPTDGGVEVHTERSRLRADKLVLAGGAWSGRIPGLPELPVRPLRGQMLTLAAPGLKLTRVLSGPTYLAPWRGGEVVVGATEEDAGFAQDTTPLGMLQLLASAVKVCPGVRDARFVRSWAGLRSSTPDGRPLIGPHPDAPNVVIATGHGGQGILTGALTGQSVAEWIEHGRSPTAEAFTPARAIQRAQKSA